MRPMKKPQILFWTTSVLVLFWGLGEGSLRGSESRWGEIARNMLRTGDYLHPIINHEFYFDKPLLTYWLVSLASFLTRGLDEFSVRLPSVLMALLTLGAVLRLGRKLWDEEVARMAAWLVLTSYGFLVWARNGQADIGNTSVIFLAVTWFFERKDRPGFFSYFVFYLICALGAHLKGLTAIVIPVLALLPYLLRNGNWRPHVRLSHLAAILLCVGIYVSPFALTGFVDPPAGYSHRKVWIPGIEPGKELSGFELVYVENIIRFFNPYDHRDPIYSYLYHLPRLLAPWSFLLVGAVAGLLMRYRRLDPNSRWLLEAVGMIFLFFTASGSRRWYYILPIIPFAGLAVAVFLQRPESERLKRACFGLTFGLLGTLGALCATCWIGVGFAGDRLPMEPPKELLLRLSLIGLASLLPLAALRSRPAWASGLLGLEPRVAAATLSALVLVSSTVYLDQNVLDQFRTGRPFARELRALHPNTDDIVFLDLPSSDLIFYLDAPGPIPVIREEQELRDLFAQEHGGFVLLTQPRRIEQYRAAIPEAALEEVILREVTHPWEESDRQWVAWKVPPSAH